MLPTPALPPADPTRSAADIAFPAPDPFEGFLETYWGFD